MTYEFSTQSTLVSCYCHKMIIG